MNDRKNGLPDEAADREYMQADDEMPGEDFSDMLKRLGLTEEEYWDLNS